MGDDEGVHVICTLVVNGMHFDGTFTYDLGDQHSRRESIHFAPVRWSCTIYVVRPSTYVNICLTPSSLRTEVGITRKSPGYLTCVSVSTLLG